MRGTVRHKEAQGKESSTLFQGCPNNCCSHRLGQLVKANVSILLAVGQEIQGFFRSLAGPFFFFIFYILHFVYMSKNSYIQLSGNCFYIILTKSSY